MNDGGPAFPMPNEANMNDQEGMSLRAWFAGMAISSVMREPGTENWLPSVLATEALAVADALIAELDKGGA